MTLPAPMVEIWRGPVLESQHFGHAVVCNASGEILLAWGDPSKVILPRSSAKMLQALPLIESGAAQKFGLTLDQLALSCASHSGAAIHTDRVQSWLSQLQLSDDDLRCGAQVPQDRDARTKQIRAEKSPCQYHNNCSGKHAGFLTLAKHLKSGPEYHEIDHPVQQACLAVFNEVTEETSSGFGIDGCSAPNHAVSLHGMARAMAFFAAANPDGSLRERAAAQLRIAMATYPELVAGEGRACTRLMRAMDHKVVVKTGAEGFFIAIIPSLKLGVALKITDGATRAAETAIAAILVKLGVLDARHPEALRYTNGAIKNWNGIQTGWMRASAALR
ncbi:asparaginase [Cognatishimia sp. WU-CL00825]|uniref:asparaginase n=1 Tax=Cognatishimia sp. WU-CL00825 TaxID=3127658 RepID=UPI003365668E